MAKLSNLGIILTFLLGIPHFSTASLAQIPENICQSSFRTIQTAKGQGIPVRSSNHQ